ncbi:S phase cyclin A-associated protein in the endoplasmic reticulum-like [Lethenteron reissneri]|uniref:S phase cyclin A-associated protein in the endoplasmic reticulum-like n=1 Tax=Lethenteron reissneri TaxID=7753 RepID=UPI002AB608CA|nr:S phase cyclin A-associated protein in the endoplasmic reticulum-like [Lethenteron reissneri]
MRQPGSWGAEPRASDVTSVTSQPRLHPQWRGMHTREQQKKPFESESSTRPSNFKQNLLLPNNMDRQITWAEILDDYEARESACQSTTWGDVMDKVDPFPGQSYKNRSPKRIIGELKDVSGVKHLQEKNLGKERCTMEEERLFEVQRIARAKCRTEEKYFRDYLLKKRLIKVKYFIDEKHHREMKCAEEKSLEEEEKCLDNVKHVEEEKRLEQEQRFASIATITTTATGPIAPSFGEECFQAEKMEKKTEVEQEHEEEKVEAVLMG